MRTSEVKCDIWRVISHHTVWGKQLAESRDEHLSLPGPRGGNGAAIRAPPHGRDCFSKFAFCAHIVCTFP